MLDQLRSRDRGDGKKGNPRRPPWVASLIAVTVGCGGDAPTPPLPPDPAPEPAPRVATSMEAITARHQLGVVGESVDAPPRVRVRDQRGDPIAGVEVAFSLISGGGAIGNSTAPTGAGGEAAVGDWALGTVPGRNQLRATADDLPALDFTADGQPGPPASLTIVQGDGQTGMVGTWAPILPTVRAVDEFDNHAVGRTVSFRVTEGNGIVIGGDALVGEDGTAAPERWSFGTRAGLHVLRASAGSAGPVAFEAVVERGPPAEIRWEEGGASGGETAGSTLEPPLSVRVGDRWGNGVSGATVTFTLVQGGGSITDSIQVTGEDGIATLGSWTMGPELGLQTVIATADSVPGDTLVWTELTVPGPVVSLTLVTGDGQTGEVGEPLPVVPVVFAVDALGHPAAGQEIFRSVISGGGSLSGGKHAFDSQGLAEVGAWILGPEEGIQQVRVRAGSDSLTISATAIHADYDIDLRFIGAVTASQMAAFEGARQRWEEIIVEDVPQMTLADICLFDFVRDIVDDMLIFVEITDLDGRGGSVGHSEPCALRHPDLLPAAASIRLDREDLVLLEARGLLNDFITHEMGHALGIGRLWSIFNLVVGPGSTDPFYVGTAGRIAFEQVGGAAYAGRPVPVERSVDEDIGEEHWREAVFGPELMTPTLEEGVVHPLSIVTIAALQDLGYPVDPDAADPYSLPVDDP